MSILTWGCELSNWLSTLAEIAPSPATCGIWSWGTSGVDSWPTSWEVSSICSGNTGWGCLAHTSLTCIGSSLRVFTTSTWFSPSSRVPFTCNNVIIFNDYFRNSSVLVNITKLISKFMISTQYFDAVFLLRLYGAQLAQRFVNLAQKFLRKYKENSKIILDLAQPQFQISSKMFKLAQEQKP